MFTLQNTLGYTQRDCDALNREFERRYAAGEWGDDDGEFGTARSDAQKAFSDIVAGRHEGTDHA